MSYSMAGPERHDAVAVMAGYFNAQSAIGASDAHMLSNPAIGTFSLSGRQNRQIGGSAGGELGGPQRFVDDVGERSSAGNGEPVCRDPTSAPFKEIATDRS